jgi:hypothetical protein
MTLQYSFERLSLGVEILATHPGAIRARLSDAFHKSLCQVVPSLLPIEAREIWESVWKDVTSLPSGNREGVFDRSIDLLSDDDAVSTVRQILQVERMVRIAIALDASPDVLLL